MRRMIAVLTAVGTLAAAGLSATGTASALGGETFGCRVSPNPTVPPYTETCRNRQYASMYVAGFVVENVSAPSTYSWSIPSAYQGAVYAGCTSDRPDCGISMPNEDAQLTVSVTIIQNGASRTMTSTATILQYCGQYPC